jgi:hypothetical protein
MKTDAVPTSFPLMYPLSKVSSLLKPNLEVYLQSFGNKDYQENTNKVSRIFLPYAVAVHRQ